MGRIGMKFWCGVLFFLLLLTGNPVRAENFYIDNYAVAMQVTESRTVKVREHIEVYFTSPSHGIIRSIPLKKSSVYHVAVNQPFEVSRLGGDAEIKIGEADKLVSGPMIYDIQYTLQMYSDKPEFYYNIIGTEWDVPIVKASFAVEMPDKVDAEKVGLSIGGYGTRGFDGGARFSADGSRIVGVVQRRLQPHEGVTLRVEVPEGYFLNVYNKWEKLVWLLLFLCTFSGFMIWYNYGKDEHVTPVVTFNAPQEINPATAELIMNEKVSEKGLIALIVELANGGYLKIKTEGKGFVLSDFKKYDGNDELERKLYKLLKKQADDKGEVTDKKLKSSILFYGEWKSLLQDANDDENKLHFYEKSSISGFFKFLLFICICGTTFLTLFSLLGYRFRIDMIMLCMVVLFVLVMLLDIFKNDDKWYSKAYAIVFLLLFLLPALAAFSDLLSGDNTSQVVGGMICMLITSVCYIEMLKPNYEGRMLKGKLLGLRKFIDVAEKDQLEAMVEENPSYFYKVLPYAYVLGVSKAWIKRFEGIALPPPEWAVGTTYGMNSFDGFADGFQSAVMPSIENGGISHSSSGGGGGFSGGGFGGGGGSSW